LVAEAPGRLELLGNHVDYNGGLVLAGAIDRVVTAVASVAGDQGFIEIVAGDISDTVSNVPISETRDWRNASGATGPADYLKGVAASILARDLPVRNGLKISVAGDVPIGFGMSSSAGLCVALVLLLSADDVSPQEVVNIAREAEHRCGSPVGAMDQSASIAGGIILFDGRDTSFETLTPDLGDYVFAVADSGITHALGTSSYPIRVDESQRALREIQSYAFPELSSLGELSVNDFTSAMPILESRLDPALQRRVLHVVMEVDRVRAGIDAISRTDWDRFGQLMTESGQSSDANYEISHPKVEELVRQLLSLDGVLGARMMGGGEGGPALALIHANAIPHVAEALEQGYFRDNPSHLDGDRLQVARFGSGARLITFEGAGQ
jgi:galactokinase